MAGAVPHPQGNNSASLTDLALNVSAEGTSDSQGPVSPHRFVSILERPSCACGKAGRIRKKLIREISGGNPVPEPSTYGAIGAGLLVVLGLRRRMKAKKDAPDQA